MTSYTPAELTVVIGSRSLQDGQVIFAGAGLPLLAAVHAQNLHAPTLAILFEVGGIAPQIKIGGLPRSTNEARSARTTKLTSVASAAHLCPIRPSGYRVNPSNATII